jgi:tetratricopeptide (TPR) repeat protein
VPSDTLQEIRDRALLEWIEGAAPAIALDGPSDPAELEAIALGFELVERESRRRPALLRTLGYLHLRERRWEDADAAFLAAAAAGDEEPAARLALDRARLALVRGDPERAIAAASRGLTFEDLWPATRDELRDALERALSAAGRGDEALAILEARAADSGASLELHHRLARERLARNDLDRAGAALERAAQVASILGRAESIEVRVSACFDPIVAELRAAGRVVDADALVARATIILGAN